jgi:succinyl-diaminopimelate desuccinylase
MRAQLKAKISSTIDARADEFIELLREFLRIRSVNPPGDTVEAARFIERVLDSYGVPHRRVTLAEDMPNIVGRWDGAKAGKHLILNGHMDVFPVTDEAQWAAEVTDGKIYGRGTVDMKTGTFASVLAYCLLHEFRDELAGALTLTVVSDEQSGSQFGTKFLFDTIADEITGDCCLNGEPSGMANLRFMEKGTLRFSVSSHSKGGHGGYPHHAPNAIKQVCDFTQAVYQQFHLKRAPLPEDISRTLESPASVEAANRDLGQGAADVGGRITVNIGVINGGKKATQIAPECTAHLDMRVPVGFDRDEIRKSLDELARAHQCTLLVNEGHSYPASMTDPNHPMALLLRRNIAEQVGIEPAPIASLGGTDTRFWRWKGVPAFIYGPSPLTMGSDQEHVPVEDVLKIFKVHALTAVDVLTFDEAQA